MAIVKVGHKFVNVDNISYVHQCEDGYIIEFVVGMSLFVKEQDAAPLIEWLEAVAIKADK